MVTPSTLPASHQVTSPTSPAPALGLTRDAGPTDPGWRNFRMCTLALLIGVLASGCDTSGVVGNASEGEAATTDEDPTMEDDDSALGGAAPIRQDPDGVHAGDRAHWADGYAWADNPTAGSYTPSLFYSFNRTSGAIQITKPAGTTGRYKVKFAGLAAYLGRSTVQVTGYGTNNHFCKLVGPKLVKDVVEVRCFDANTGAAVNAYYSVLTTRNYPDVAFAHAHQPTGTNYPPLSSASWNPQGGMRVFRRGVGEYRVDFAGLTALTASNGGNVQVSAVGTGKQYCKVQAWGGSPDLSVFVGCFSPTGAPADTKFNVLFLLPSAHLAYAWASSPTNPSYTPPSYYSTNPAGGAVSISRIATGRYIVDWSGASYQFLDGGNAQVTGYGSSNTQCKVEGWGAESATVRCFLPNGAPADEFFSVLLGS